MRDRKERKQEGEKERMAMDNNENHRRKSRRDKQPINRINVSQLNQNSQSYDSTSAADAIAIEATVHELEQADKFLATVRSRHHRTGADPIRFHLQFGRFTSAGVN